MSYVKVDVNKPTALMPGNGGNLKDKVIVFDWNDVTSGYVRDASGIVMPGSLIFIPGSYAIKLYATQDSIKSSAESSGDTDAEGVIQNIDFSHPGNLKEIKEFQTSWLGKSIGIIVEKCSDGSMTLFGSPCAPLRLSHKNEWDKDKNVSTMSFKSAQKGPGWADYLGTVTLDAVKGTAAEAATTVNVASGNGEYQLTTGDASAAVITDLSNAVDGGVYTLLGSGGAFPSTIVKGGTFLLHNGTTWTASAGAKLTVKAFKSDTTVTTLVEVSRA